MHHADGWIIIWLIHDFNFQHEEDKGARLAHEADNPAARVVAIGVDVFVDLVGESKLVDHVGDCIVDGTHSGRDDASVSRLSESVLTWK